MVAKFFIDLFMPQQTVYGYSTQVSLNFDEALKKTTELLQAEGFGVLTTIDIKAKMKEKLGKEMEDYVILGACNPPMAAKALDAEMEIGLLLPCNVIVYRKNGNTFVSAIMPSGMMKMIGKKDLEEVSQTVEGKLRRVIDAF